MAWRRTDDYRLLIGTLKHGHRFYKELWSDADVGLRDPILARMPGPECCLQMLFWFLFPVSLAAKL
jgi:hypothetical protein